MFIDRGMDKENVAHLYNGILLSNWKEWNNAICSNKDRPRDCHNEWSKTEKEKYTKKKKKETYDIPYVWNLKRNDTNELIKQRLTDLGNKLMVGCKSESCSVVSNSLWPHGLHSPWNSPSQNTGVGSLSLLQLHQKEGRKSRERTWDPERGNPTQKPYKGNPQNEGKGRPQITAVQQDLCNISQRTGAAKKASTDSIQEDKETESEMYFKVN